MTEPIRWPSRVTRSKRNQIPKKKPRTTRTKAKSSQPATVKIDAEGLDQRILALPMPEGNYSNLRAGPEGTVLFVKRDKEGESELASFSLESRETTSMLSKVNQFAVTPDGKNLMYISPSGYGIASTKGKIDPAESKLNVDGIEVRIDPRAEWKQIFNEVWRINRDYFYDPGMHGCDWVAMKSKYEPLVDRCVTRGDLNRVLMWMCSELAVGHHRVGGGQQRLEADSVGGGLLGADYEIVNDRYRFKKVLGGLNWNGKMRAPLTEPGVRVQPGEYLLAVNGQALSARDNLHRHFENTAGKIVELTVGPNPDGSKSREVKVVPVDNESQLRNRAWVEGNLQKVNQATGGRVAYVYVPNTTGAGHTYFKRYFSLKPTSRRLSLMSDSMEGGRSPITISTTCDGPISVIGQPVTGMILRHPARQSMVLKSCSSMRRQDLAGTCCPGCSTSWNWGRWSAAEPGADWWVSLDFPS